MTKTIISKGNIDNDLWPELVFAITYIKISCLTRASTTSASTKYTSTNSST